MVAAWGLVARLAAVWCFSAKEDPDGGNLPAYCQAVQAGGRLQRLPHLRHGGVQQPGDLVEPLHSPLHDLSTRDGLGHAFASGCEDDVSTGQKALGLVLSLLTRVPHQVGRPLGLGGGGEGLHPAQSEAQKVADLAAVPDVDLRRVWRKFREGTDSRGLLCATLPVVLHLWTNRHTCVPGLCCLDSILNLTNFQFLGLNLALTVTDADYDV